ncbi:hypothetical protein GCM10010448_24460 [Streptomyces glomeratus]|uniref:Uncharacterized protein n=1 Tax=Streptomyces glomeratus TaxID=284452 RepID=A0ABP6LE31_9ACTN
MVVRGEVPAQHPRQALDTPVTDRPGGSGQQSDGGGLETGASAPVDLDPAHSPVERPAFRRIACVVFPDARLCPTHMRNVSIAAMTAAGDG